MIQIGLAVNNDNGLMTDRLDSIIFNLPEGDFQLDSNEGLSFRYDGKAIAIGEYWFPVQGMNYYVGNICWNYVTVTDETAQDILDYIRKFRDDLGTGWGDITIYDRLWIDKKRILVRPSMVTRLNE